MRFFVLFLFSSFAFSLSAPRPIPRVKTSRYLTEGVLTGGTAQTANLEAIRFSPHKDEGYERWVIDFSDKTSRLKGTVAPRFQIRYLKSPKIENITGNPNNLVPHKFIFLFQRIGENYISQETLKAQLKKSRFVKDITLYPAIENGDMAMEFVLKDSVAFEAHQPIDREGRLVLDLKNAPL